MPSPLFSSLPIPVISRLWLELQELRSQKLGSDVCCVRWFPRQVPELLGAEYFGRQAGQASTGQGEGFPAGVQRLCGLESRVPPPLFVPLLGAEISS